MSMPYTQECIDDWERDSRRRARWERASKKRQAKIVAARAKGSHSKRAWNVLSALFGRCVVCGIPYERLHGGAPTKDHIVGIGYGGCDCIANLQPMCRQCNVLSNRHSNDWRNLRRPGWVRDFISIMTGAA